MAARVELTDVNLDYASIAEARKMSGLRLVLGAYAIPGPWRESCKGLFHVKRIPYTPVVTSGEGFSDLDFGRNGADAELRAWTGQSSAPVALWNNERPRINWADQLHLAELLNPDPPLIPVSVADQTVMFGLIQLLAGEGGFGWTKRIAILHRALTEMDPDDLGRSLWVHVGQKYLYTPELGAAAPRRMASIVAHMDQRLEAQKMAGSHYFIGNQLSALDIYWACFVALLQPLSPALCPMGDWPYNNPDEEVRAVLSTLLLEHRDYIYEKYLELPIVF